MRLLVELAVGGGARQGRARKEKATWMVAFSVVLIGRDERIRTSDHLHPMQVRYQAALHPETRRED